MPKMPVDEAPAGPEMDAAVAEALGWELMWVIVHPPFGFLPSHFSTREECEAACISEQHPEKLWMREDQFMSSLDWSTDIAAAWGLWELLSKQEPWSWALYSEGEEVAIEYYGEDYLGEREAGCGDWEMEGKAPLAICRAFLKANSVEHVEVPE